MTSVPTMRSMPSLSKLMAFLLQVLIDSHSPNGRLQEAYETLGVFQSIAERVERDWTISTLSTVESDIDIGISFLPLSSSTYLSYISIFNS